MALGNNEMTPRFEHLEDGRVENVYKTPEAISDRIKELVAMGLNPELAEKFQKRALEKCQVAEGTEQHEVVCTIVGTEVERAGLRLQVEQDRYKKARITAIQNVADGISDILDGNNESDIDYPNAA